MQSGIVWLHALPLLPMFLVILAIALAVAALIVAAGALSVTLQAQADCAGASVQDVKRRYANAQQLDKAGKLREALGAYAAATEYTCEANPVAAPAAKRAAEIALPLGQDAERDQDLDQREAVSLSACLGVTSTSHSCSGWPSAWWQ